MSTAVQKICQVGGFLFLMSMLFLALSLGSYTSGDPTWNHYVSHDAWQERHTVRNLGGIVGASLADAGMQALGCTILGLVGVGGLSAWRLLSGNPLGAAMAFGRGGMLLVALSTSVYYLFKHDPIFGMPIRAGGILGQWTGMTLVYYLNNTGAYFVLLTVSVLVASVGISLESLRERWQRRGLRLVHGAQRVSTWVQHGWHNLLTLARQAKAALQRCMDAVIGSEQDDTDWVSATARAASDRRVTVLDAFPTFAPALPDRQVVHEDHDGARNPSSVTEQEPLAPYAPMPAALAPSPPTAALTRDLSPPRRSVEKSSGGSKPPAILDRDAAGTHVVHLPPRPTPRSGSSTPSYPPASSPRNPSFLSGCSLPSLDILDPSPPSLRDQSPEDLKAQALFLEQKLRDFGVEGEVVQVLPGPVITMYEFAPAPGVKVSKIANLQDDLALVMRALSVRVVAPVPGKAVVGIEIPNKRRETVSLRDLLGSEEFHTSTSMLTLALGKDIFGKPVVTDLALIPHLLIAGATGSGKSVGLNSMICSLLFRATPADVRMIMIDPKMLELSIYDGIPHLLVPVVTQPKKAAVALRRVVEEMERRYQLMAATGVRSIAQYNQVVGQTARTPPPDLVSDDLAAALPAAVKLPYLVVVIDELSDLMMVSSREVEDSLTRVAQMARAAGIHLIVATQRPSVDVLTGVIKANFPARVSFQVSSKTDSRTILDANGAEKLLGRGDMLFLAPGTSKSQRIHGAYVSEAEINRLVASWKAVELPHYDDSFLVASSEQSDIEEEEYDEKYDEAIALVARTGQASISMLQRRLRVGYNRAARMIEIMEKEGIIGPADGVKPREVLMRRDYDEEV